MRVRRSELRLAPAACGREPDSVGAGAGPTQKPKPIDKVRAIWQAGRRVPRGSPSVVVGVRRRRDRRGISRGVSRARRDETSAFGCCFTRNAARRFDGRFDHGW